MKKLALSDDILLKVDKPARYIGNEVNSTVKDPEKVDISAYLFFCINFLSPNANDVGC